MAGNIIRALVLFVTAASVFGCATAWTEEGGMRDKAVTVTGRLERVVSIGGETTGWAVTPEGGITIGGKDYARIEVDPKGMDLRPLQRKSVEATGTLVKRKGVERGEYLVIELGSIKEAGL